MKKFFISFVLIFIFTLTLSLGRNLNDGVVFADNDFKQYAVINGTGEILASADTIKMSFGIRLRDDDISNGQSKISETFNNICTKVKEIDESANCYVSYSSCYPVSENGLSSYEFSTTIMVVSKNLNLENDIIKVASENGATSYHHTQFVLDDKQTLYNDALKKAKDNALEKAKSLYSDVTMTELCEIDVYSYQDGGQIKIEASVRAKFVITNDTQSQQSQTEDVNYTVSDEIKIDDNDDHDIFDIEKDDDDYITIKDA